MAIVALVVWFGYWAYEYYQLAQSMHILPCNNRDSVPPELGCYYFDSALAKRDKVVPFALLGAAVGSAAWFAFGWVIKGLNSNKK
jgi:hypothetical protein